MFHPVKFRGGITIALKKAYIPKSTSCFTPYSVEKVLASLSRRPVNTNLPDVGMNNSTIIPQGSLVNLIIFT